VVATTILAFDIAQFFLSLNHQLIPLIMNKADFNPKVSCFFSNYLVGKKPNIYGTGSLLLLLT